MRFWERLTAALALLFGRSPCPPTGGDSVQVSDNPQESRPMQKIEHLIILMMENRSFDHYLGSLSLTEGRKDIDGLTAALKPIPDEKNKPVPFWNMDAIFSGYLDPPHDPKSQTANYHNGTNDGFVQQYQLEMRRQEKELPRNPKTRPDIPVGYYTRKALPVLYALTD